MLGSVDHILFLPLLPAHAVPLLRCGVLHEVLQWGSFRRAAVLLTFIPAQERHFFSENNQSLQQSPQRRGRVLTAGGFQDVIAQGARRTHPGALSRERLDRMIFQCPVQPGLFCRLVILTVPVGTLCGGYCPSEGDCSSTGPPRATAPARRPAPARAPLHKPQLVPGACSSADPAGVCSREDVCSRMDIRSRVDVCSRVDLHGLRVYNLHHHGLRQGLQWNLCSVPGWSASSPSFFTHLGVYEAVSLTISPPLSHSVFLPFLKCVMAEAAPASLTGSALTCGGSLWTLAGSMSAWYLR